MSDLLTADEYRAIAAGLTFPSQAFIDGGFRPARSGATFSTLNPATRSELASVAACGAGDVDVAVEKAREAFDDGRWSRLKPVRTQRCVDPACQTSEAERSRTGRSGKPRFRQDNI